jgi:hypothetical protein
MTENKPAATTTQEAVTPPPIEGKDALLQAVIKSNIPLSPDDQTALTLIYSPEELSKGEANNS